jgi:hypothetical protein
MYTKSLIYTSRKVFLSHNGITEPGRSRRWHSASRLIRKHGQDEESSNAENFKVEVGVVLSLGRRPAG